MPRIKFATEEAQRAYDAARTVPERVALAFDGIMQHVPSAQRHLIATKAAAKHDGTLSQRLIELTRIRMAFWTQCRTCMTIRFEEGVDDGLDQAAICALERPETAAYLSDAEKAAIRYVDKFANDWLSIGSEELDRLRVHFTESEIVQLGLVCALHLGTGRMMASYGVIEDLPAEMQGTESAPGKFKPWEVDFESLIMPPLPDADASTVSSSLRTEKAAA